MVLGQGLFVPTSDRKYVLLVNWCPGPKDKPVALVRLRDAKRWTLPSLPRASVERYGLWYTYHGDLDVHPVDNSCPSLSFSVFVKCRDSRMASRHTLKCGRWEIEELVPVVGEPPETSETFEGPGRRDFTGGAGEAGRCAKVRPQIWLL